MSQFVSVSSWLVCISDFGIFYSGCLFPSAFYLIERLEPKSIVHFFPVYQASQEGLYVQEHYS